MDKTDSDFIKVVSKISNFKKEGYLHIYPIEFTD